MRRITDGIFQKKAVIYRKILPGPHCLLCRSPISSYLKGSKGAQMGTVKVMSKKLQAIIHYSVVEVANNVVHPHLNRRPLTF